MEVVISSEIVNAARGLLKATGYYVDNLWHIDDIHFICEQKRLRRLSHHEAMQVFEIANDYFDGGAGISWPQLEKAIDMFLAQEQAG